MATVNSDTPIRKSDIFFMIIKEGPFGDIVYEETDGSVIQNQEDYSSKKIPFGPVSAPSFEEGSWLIKNPSNKCKEKYPEAEIRMYNTSCYLFSKLAVKIPPPNQNGEAVVIEVKIKGNRYFLMMADNKKYIQNCQGGKNKNDKNEGECILRELKEELNIKCDKTGLIKLGHWSFQFDLLKWLDNYSYLSTTTLFYLNLPYEKVIHLDPRKRLMSDNIKEQIIIYDAKLAYSFELDETDFVYFILVPEGEGKCEMESYPSKIGGKDFNDHHREVLRRLCGLSPQKQNYLIEFDVNTGVLDK